MLLDDPVLREIGLRHHKSAAQVVLRWLIQRSVTVIPKSCTKARIQENMQVGREEGRDGRRGKGGGREGEGGRGEENMYLKYTHLRIKYCDEFTIISPHH